MKLTKGFVLECRKVNVLRDFLCQAMDQVDQLEEAQRWRKFPEEKPEKDSWCLVYHEGEIDADHYTDECNNHCRFVMYGNIVTHWMPLPKKPEDF